MRVVVLGATGNVGTSVVQSLAAEPEVTSVLGVARRLPDWQVPKTRWVAADVTSDDLVAQLRGADVVVHLAWLIQPTHDPRLTWRVNVLGSVRILRAVAEARVPVLVYASSVGAYSPGPKDRAVDESWPTHGQPTAAYTREKAYLERLLDTFEREHPDRRVVRLRPGFIFKREAASQQRRLGIGPLLPLPVVRPGLVPVLPDLPGLRFQAVHSLDVGDAYRLAAIRPVRGAFNLAAEPALDMSQLARLLDARTIRVPTIGVRAVLATAWHLHLVPASPQLLDAVLQLPIMDVTRARDELGWTPRHSSLDAVREFLDGLRAGDGMRTPPLSPHTSGPWRIQEIRTGVGQRP